VVDVLGDLVAVAVLDRGGLILRVTDYWTTITGWSEDRAVGVHWLDLVHPDDREQARAIAREAIRTTDPVRYDYDCRVVSPDGDRVRWVNSRVTSTRGDDGAVDRWLLAVSDVTGHKEAEDALRRSQQRLQMIFDNSADVITILEPDGSWRSTTPNVGRLLGLPDDDLSKDGFTAVLHPDDREVAKAVFDDLVNQKDGSFGRLYEVRVVLADGSIRWVETTGANLVDEPAVGGIVLHSRDVTARHRTEEELLSVSSRLAALIGSVNLGVRISDQHGTTIAVNQTFADVMAFNGAPEELLGEVAPEMLERLLRVLSNTEEAVTRIVEIVAGRAPVADVQFTLVDGRTISASFMPITADGDYRGNMWLVRDRTEELAVAAEREYLLEIERQQNARLIELDALKTGLVASVSHELRTPLTSIVSFTQLLREGLGVDSADDQAEFLDIIGRNTDRLLRLVDDLLLLDRMESNAVQTTIEPVDVASLVEQAASSIHPVAVENGVDLRVHTDNGPSMLGDVGRLGQMVDNLLANAVKFTPPGGRASVAARPTDDGWVVEVADTGIGIPADEQCNLFQRFFRASNARQRSAAGSGLGLAIVRRVAELHRGDVTFESGEGVGTIFTVTLRGAVEPAMPASPLTRATAWHAQATTGQAPAQAGVDRDGG